GDDVKGAAAPLLSVGLDGGGFVDLAQVVCLVLMPTGRDASEDDRGMRIDGLDGEIGIDQHGRVVLRLDADVEVGIIPIGLIPDLPMADGKLAVVVMADDLGEPVDKALAEGRMAPFGAVVVD